MRSNGGCPFGGGHGPEPSNGSSEWAARSVVGFRPFTRRLSPACGILCGPPCTADPGSGSGPPRVFRPPAFAGGNVPGGPMGSLPWREGAAPGVEDGGTQPPGPWGCSSSPALHNDGLFLDAYASLPPSPTHTRTRARMVFSCFCVRGQRPGPLENHGFFMFLCVGTEAGTLEKPWFFMFLCVGTEAGHLAAPSSRPRAREGAKARPHSRPPRQSRAEGELRHARRRR